MNEARVRAPELPDHLEWFNTDYPLRLSELRGKVVLLDFWTYCCINCMHILPDLRYLENKYKEKLVVIGIHSPKFPNENVLENVQKAINRYHIRHPVAHDSILRVWTKYAIRAWPSVVLIDPEGYVVGSLRGEGRRRQLDQLIQNMVDAAEEKDILNLDPVPLRKRPEPAAALQFPGKIHATHHHLYISDSGHNRVLQTNHYGRVTQVFGSSAAGLLDGFGDTASFNDPQGLRKIEDFLYIADTGNHAIRRINLLTREVSTLAGTGEQGRREAIAFPDPLSARLNSPWDLAYKDGNLYIAMAGQHQIWCMDLTQNTLVLLSGSGQEALIDGPGHEAALAQPSGMTVGGYGLYVADAETSAIRSVRLPDGMVSTIVGKGLFEFGDQDGNAAEARLQHPLGVVCDQAHSLLYVADTYNHKIRIIDLKTREVSTLRIDAQLQEPGGLCLQDQTLWIANTNAHNIVRVDTRTRQSETLEINE